MNINDLDRYIFRQQPSKTPVITRVVQLNKKKSSKERFLERRQEVEKQIDEFAGAFYDYKAATNLTHAECSAALGLSSKRMKGPHLITRIYSLKCRKWKVAPRAVTTPGLSRGEEFEDEIEDARKRCVVAIGHIINIIREECKSGVTIQAAIGRLLACLRVPGQKHEPTVGTGLAVRNLLAIGEVQGALTERDSFKVTRLGKTSKHKNVIWSVGPNAFDYSAIVSTAPSPSRRQIGSAGERMMRSYLQEAGKSFIEQYTGSGCIYRSQLRYDFAIVDEQTSKILCLIEVDGEQHFKPVARFDKAGSASFDRRQTCDQIKNDWAIASGIPLIRVPWINGRFAINKLSFWNSVDRRELTDFNILKIQPL